MGSGLGLAEVYGTVRTHDGAITVESAADRGTTFVLLLPAVDEVAPMREEREPQRRAPKRPLRVLIADDEQNVRLSLGLLLRTGGHEVVECADGEQAVRRHRADAGRIDVVILDMMMPDMPGSDVLPKLRDVSPDVPVIVSSGFSAGSELEELRGQRGVFYLGKPYTTAQLERTLAEACRQA